MKKYNLILICLAFLLVSCYDEPDWIGDNTTTEGKHFPVIATFTTDGYITNSNTTEYFFGENIPLDLRFWSEDPIKNITLSKIDDVSTEEILSIPHTPNFSHGSQTDSLYHEYTVPVVDRNFSIEAKITNENELDRSRSIKFCVCENADHSLFNYSVTTSIDTFTSEKEWDSVYTSTMNMNLMNDTKDNYIISDLSGGYYSQLAGMDYLLLDTIPRPDRCTVASSFVDSFHQNSNIDLSMKIFPDHSIELSWENTEAGIRGTQKFTEQ